METGRPFASTASYSHIDATRSCRDPASPPFFPLRPFVSAFAAGTHVPSSWTASVRGTLRPPSGTARCFAVYSRLSHAGDSCAASASRPRASVSDRTFETDTSPSPSQESVSRASWNDPSRAPSRQTVSEAARVIFRSTPNAAPRAPRFSLSR